MESRWRTYMAISIFCTQGMVLFGHECEAGLDFPGYTVPHGDIMVQYGSPLDIICVLNESAKYGQNASQFLSFRMNSKDLPNEMIDVINSTAIKLHIEKPDTMAGARVSCNLNDTLVCNNFVSVGTPPKTVTDFECIGYNYESLTCTWTPPQNFVETIYNLTYHVSHRSSRTPLDCPEIKYLRTKDTKMSCFWNISTTPHYRQAHDTFYFNLTMNNAFGSNYITTTFAHFAHVWPAPPERLTMMNSTPSSLFLHWKIPQAMQAFPKGVHHRILYQCEYEGKEYRLGGIINTDPHDKEKYFNLTNIKHGYEHCDVKIAIRSAVAFVNDETMWSPNSSFTGRTKSRIPEHPPNTTVGSIQVLPVGHSLQFHQAYIYWKQIPQKEQNGPQFGYFVTVDSQGSQSPKIIKNANAYAQVLNLSVALDYKFNIWSENVNGTSELHSTVFLPKEKDRLKEPVSFTKEEFGNGHIEVSWEPPELQPGQYITNYTVFWCNNKRERPHQCNGQLDWDIVSNETTTHTVHVDPNKIFQFAISANSEHSTSGMLWAGCTIIHNANMGKMKPPLFSSVGTTFIDFGWKLECTDRIGNVKGFVIFYCPLKSNYNSECIGPEKNQTFVGDATMTSGRVEGLEPDTHYVFTIAAITKHSTLSQLSDRVYNTTDEDAPNSPPLNIAITDVTNSSISLEWNPPSRMNGKLRKYLIFYNNKVVDTSKDQITLYGLESFVNYSIEVEACTKRCSGRSSAVNVTTDIGYPGVIVQPTVEGRNNTAITIIWNAPSPPRGRNDYYIVSFRESDSGNRTSEYNVTNRQYVITDCGDNGRYNEFYVSVRAVNKGDWEVFPGNSSSELQYYCEAPANYLIVFLVIGVIIFFFMMAYLFNRIYLRCKVMRDVEVKLPPGLAPAVTAEHNTLWSTNLHPEKPDSSPPPPDEELLLIKMGDCQNFNSRDSSGCSSGHESVTSSLESSTHISSSSDSGTEQTGGIYAVLGTDPKLEPIYMCDVDSTESSSYVMSGEPMNSVKTVNPGYVAFDQPEQMTKNPTTGYVVAGMKNGNGYVVAGIKNVKVD